MPWGLAAAKELLSGMDAEREHFRSGEEGLAAATEADADECLAAATAAV